MFRRTMVALVAMLVIAPTILSAQGTQTDEVAITENVSVQTEIDVMDDTEEHTVFIVDEEKEAIVGIACNPDGPKLVGFGTTGFTLDDEQNLQIRWDKEPAYFESWRVEQDGAATLLVKTADAEIWEWARNTQNHAQLAVRMEDGDTWVFSLNGVREAFSRVPCFE